MKLTVKLGFLSKKKILIIGLVGVLIVAGISVFFLSKYKNKEQSLTYIRKTTLLSSK